jgi:hypothetical protein
VKGIPTPRIHKNFVIIEFLTSNISRQTLIVVIPTEKLSSRKKECHVTEARELFLIPRLTKTN